jgi:Spy/CpxP family protein refolding chaperone
MNLRSAVPRSFRVRFLGAGFFAVVLLLVVGTACDATQASDDADTDAVASEETVTLDALIAGTTASLGLSGPQSDRMGDLARRFRGQPPRPGALWTAAAEMHATLTGEQIDSLEARLRAMSERLATRRGHGPRHGPGFGLGTPPNGRGMSGPGMGRRGPRGAGPHGPGAGPDLTDEQKEALREIRSTYRQQYQDLIGQYADGDVAESEAANAYIELAAALREEAHAVLTDEQRAQIEERRERWGERRAARQAARNEALTLSEVQANGYDAMRQLERGPRRRGGFVGNFDAWLTAREALLTDEQTEITIVHASLAAEHMRRMMQHRRGSGGRGPGGGPSGGGPSGGGPSGGGPGGGGSGG